MEKHNNQILLIDKPLGWTSFDVVKKMKNLLGVKKIGHAGTLDPLATGLLILATGTKTKEISTIQAEKKSYIATFCLGCTTKSLDTEFFPESFQDCSNLDITQIQKVINNNFLGKIDQIPPKFSAVNIEGKRAYKLAREGQDFEIKSKEVEIYQFKILGLERIYPSDIPLNNHLLRKNKTESYNKPDNLPKISLIKFSTIIDCSKGTYIRSLARDLGEKIGFDGYLLDLKRTNIGSYQLDDAKKITDFSLTE